MENKNTFGNNLIRIRKEQGLTQTDLAKMIGVSQRMIVYYEKEVKRPPLDRVEAIAKALNVSIDELIKINTSKNKNLFSNLDTRTLKKFEQILSLNKSDRHIVYSLVDSLIKKKK